MAASERTDQPRGCRTRFWRRTAASSSAASSACLAKVADVERDYVFGWLLSASYAGRLGNRLVLTDGTVFGKHTADAIAAAARRSVAYLGLTLFFARAPASL